ncbi:DUF1016 N-terminal domain-containing protein [Cryobacterium sp. M23]|uniref:DUF1016 N-terminal domain-containing protein n=1 Tax=Cryobacterium sp. M23 TaxID=2048292 RepID=UPI00351A787F
MRIEFPHMTRFPPGNLQYMRKFAGAWTAETPISQQAAGKLAGGHNMVCLDKLDGIEARDWYATAAVKNDWPVTFCSTRSRSRTALSKGALERAACESCESCESGRPYIRADRGKA